MDLLTFLTLLLLCNTWLPMVPTGLVFCLVMFSYVFVNVRMAHWHWTHFKAFYAVLAAMAGSFLALFSRLASAPLTRLF